MAAKKLRICQLGGIFRFLHRQHFCATPCDVTVNHSQHISKQRAAKRNVSLTLCDVSIAGITVILTIVGHYMNNGCFIDDYLSTSKARSIQFMMMDRVCRRCREVSTVKRRYKQQICYARGEMIYRPCIIRLWVVLRRFCKFLPRQLFHVRWINHEAWMEHQRKSITHFSLSFKCRCVVVELRMWSVDVVIDCLASICCPFHLMLQN